MRCLLKDNRASAVPLILFVVTIVGVGALYTLFFLQFGIPQFDSWIPSSNSKTFLMTGIYAMPLIILMVGVVCLLKAGLKRSVY